MNTAIALLIFNRPEATRKVFAEIARAKPPKLLVVADGPRADHPGEEEKVLASRALIEQVDWDCEVLTNFADSNMGCKRRVSSGITWVFESVADAIILEDDCLPDRSFFPFCEELLEKYRADERVTMISGDNFQLGRRRTPYSYYLSRYVHVWGWASWRRAWQHYDVEMKLWPELRDTNWLSDLLGDERAAQYWRQIFDNVYAGAIDTWDYQWSFACWSQNGLSVLPEVNLVSNIGFGHQATHTKASNSQMENLPREEMAFPLLHPPYMVRNSEADHFFFEQTFARIEQRVAHGRLRGKLATIFSGLRGANSN